jgi:hypothetical protein
MLISAGASLIGLGLGLFLIGILRFFVGVSVANHFDKGVTKLLQIPMPLAL